MSEYQLKIGVFAPTGPVWPKISGKKGCPHLPFFLSETRMNDLSCGIRMWAQHVSFVLSQSTRLTDRRADRQKGVDSTVRCITMITRSRTVKMAAGWHAFYALCGRLLAALTNNWACGAPS